MSRTGMPSVIVMMRDTPASAASMMESAANGGGTKRTDVFAPVCFTASATVLNTGTLPSKVVPPLPGVTPPTSFVPYSNICFEWNEPAEPVMPWQRTFVFSLTRMLMALLQKSVGDEARGLLQRGDGLLGRLTQVVRRGDGEARVAQQFLALLHVGAFKANDEGDLELHFLGRGDDAVRDDIALHDAAEDVDQHRLHRGVGQDELEGRRHLLLARAAAHVQEVGRRAAHQLDGVHGGHGQAGAVHHAADVALERDVRQVPLLGLRLARVLFRQVPVVQQVLVTVEGRSED